MVMEKAPSLGPATGQRKIVATEGAGRLEMIDGTRVLFLKGSPEQMGRQHGKLLKEEIHNVATRILYGVGVGSSFGRGAWFVGEVEKAEARLQPFMDSRYLREMDAIADACGMDHQEARLANFFPELFHCSGFALMGSATKDGHLRLTVLDDGRGSETLDPGQGLRGLRERIEPLGGWLSTEDLAGGGFQLTVDVPIQQ